MRIESATSIARRLQAAITADEFNLMHVVENLLDFIHEAKNEASYVKLSSLALEQGNTVTLSAERPTSCVSFIVLDSYKHHVRQWRITVEALD